MPGALHVRQAFCDLQRTHTWHALCDKIAMSSHTTSRYLYALRGPFPGRGYRLRQGGRNHLFFTRNLHKVGIPCIRFAVHGNTQADV